MSSGHSPNRLTGRNQFHAYHPQFLDREPDSINLLFNLKFITSAGAITPMSEPTSDPVCMIELELSRTTKNTFRYEAKATDGFTNPVVDCVYIQKAAFKTLGKPAERIRVTIEAIR